MRKSMKRSVILVMAILSLVGTGGLVAFATGMISWNNTGAVSYKGAKDDLDKIESGINDLVTAKNKAEDKVEEIEAKLATAEKELADIKQNLDGTEDGSILSEQIKAKINSLNEQLTEAKNKLATANTNLTTANKDKDAALLAKKTAEDKLKAAEDELKAIKDAINTDNDTGNNGLPSQIAELKRKNLELKDERDEALSDKKIAEDNLASAKAEVPATTQAEIDRLNSELDQAIREMADIKSTTGNIANMLDVSEDIDSSQE